MRKSRRNIVKLMVIVLCIVNLFQPLSLFTNAEESKSETAAEVETGEDMNLEIEREMSTAETESEKEESENEREENKNEPTQGEFEGIAADEKKEEIGEGYFAESEDEMNAILHSDISLFSYHGQTLYVSAGSYTSVYDGGFTNRYNVSGDGDTLHYAYCLQPDASDPSGNGTVYEVDNFYIKLVICLGMYGPAQSYGFDAGIWPGVNEYNNGAKLPAAYGYVHATLGYLYGAGPGVGLYNEHVAQLDSWVQACMDTYNNNPEVKKIVDHSKLFYMYGGYRQDVAWVEYTPPQNGSLEIIKRSSDGTITENNDFYSLAGAVYGVYDKENQEIGRITTDENGWGQLTDIPIGEYVIKEITAPPGFYVNATPCDVTVIPGETATINTEDIPKTVPVSILLGKIDAETNSNRPSGSQSLKGALFEITYYSIQMDTDPAADGHAPERQWTLKTDKDGFCKLSDDYKAAGDDFYYDSDGNAVLPFGTVTIQEKQPPEGYLINDEVFVNKIVPEYSEDISIYNYPEIREIPQKIQIELEKVDSETMDTAAQGRAVLSGAEYEVRNSENEVVDILVTDDMGHAVSKELPLGAYNIKETVSSNGYLLDQNVYTVDASKPIDETSHVFQYKVTSGEDIVRGDVEIIKFRDNLDTDDENLIPLAGVEFSFTSKTTGNIVKVVTTDEQGWASTVSPEEPRGSLVFDTYIVTETKYPDNVKPVDPFEVTISEEGITLKGIYKENKLIASPVTVVKKDAGTGNVIPAENTEFRLLDADKNPISMTAYYPSAAPIDTFSTDENGQFTFPRQLECGTYYLEEINAPKGYLKGELLEFKVTEGSTWEKPMVIEFFDEPALGKIRIEKIDSKNGDLLDGVEFNIIAAENIVTQDGTVRLNKGDVADTLTTKDGIAESKALFPGKYEVRETKQLNGYILNQDVCNVVLEYKDQMTPVIFGEMKSENQPTKIRIFKVDEKTDEPLPGVEFKIWRKNTENEEAAPMILEEQRVITDKNGFIEMEYLSSGTYCVQETKSLYGYAPDDTVYEFVVSEDGRIDGKDIGELRVTNTPIEIYTKAVDQADGDKTVTNRERETVVDQIVYKGLIPGKEYTVKGSLMVKSTGKPLIDDGKEVTAEWTFTAEKPEGEIELTFTFNAKVLVKEKLVVFEKLFFENEEVASHADIEDEDQTVQIKKILDTPKTGDRVNLMKFAGICCMSASVIAYLWRSMRKKRNK